MRGNYYFLPVVCVRTKHPCSDEEQLLLGRLGLLKDRKDLKDRKAEE
jgi:hypothetical protein